MGSLVGKSPASTYKSLLKVSDETNGISAVSSQIEDGEGTKSCISLSDDQFIIRPQNDDTTNSVLIRAKAGSTILQADTTNLLIKAGTTSTPVNTQILEFHAKT